MVRRLLSIVAAAALLLGFVAAPYEHFHPADGVRHAHVTPHDHGHHHDDADTGRPPSDREDEQDPQILSAAGFAFQPANRQTLPTPAAIDVAAVPVESTRDGQLMEDRQPSAHAPPPLDIRSSRAPPVLPAI